MCFYRSVAILVALSLQSLVGQSADGQSARGQLTDELPAAQRVEQLARRYRILTYNTFHSDRSRYDLHRAALRGTLDAWRAAGSHEDDIERLLTWLQQATKSLKNNPHGPLPTGLEFETKISQKPAPAAKTPAHPPARQHTALRPVLPKPVLPKDDDGIKKTPAAKPPVLTAKEPVTRRQTPTVVEPETPKKPVPRQITPRSELPKVEDMTKTVPTPPTTEKQPFKKPTPAGRNIVELPTLPGFDGVTKLPPSVKVRPPKRIAPKKTPYRRRTTAKASKPPVKHLASRPKRPSSPINTARRPARSSPRRTADARTTPSVPKGKKLLARAQQSPTLPGLSAADLAGLGKAKMSGIGTIKPGDDSGSDINLIELAAQIAGTNMAFRGVEAQLSKSQSWDAVQLTPMVQALKQLSARRDDLTLFRDLLPESDRRLVGQLESPRLAISQCSARISETRTRVKSKSFRGKPGDRVGELRKLDELSRNLAKLVAGY